MNSELHRLQNENRDLKAQLTSLQRRHRNLVEHRQLEVGARERLERRLDALLWVWCSGGCGGGVLRWLPPRDPEIPRWNLRRPEITEEIVAIAEHNTKRLRTWFGTNHRRPEHPAPAPTPREG